jgi:hypothetical protein
MENEMSDDQPQWWCETCADARVGNDNGNCETCGGLLFLADINAPRIAPADPQTEAAARPARDKE